MKKSSIFFILLTIWACGSSREDPLVQLSIPDIHINESSEKVYQRGALLFVDGRPFSGYLTGVNQSERFKSVTGYYQGKKEGRAYQEYDNGQLKEERFYLNNKKHGQHRGWWKDGVPKFIIHFSNGLTHGKSLEWFADGTPFKVFHYDNGQELGSQKMWSPDGSIRANYVVKNGHRYGLIGLKNCKSVENENGSLTARLY